MIPICFHMAWTISSSFVFTDRMMGAGRCTHLVSAPALNIQGLAQDYHSRKDEKKASLNSPIFSIQHYC